MNGLQQAHSIEDLRRLARRRLPRGVFDFFDGGAEDEVTLRANREGFERIRLRPHLLVDVQQPDLSATIVGGAAMAPIVIAPTGAIGAGWPQADLAIAPHPGWCWQMLRHGQPRFENLVVCEGSSDPSASIAAKVGQSLDASFGWSDLQRLRDLWTGKLMVKGVVRGEDARRLADLGVDGVWVSNHGGRQLDGAIASAEALPQVVQALEGRVPVLIDSGVRRGVDIVRALALGAQAVAIGRATLYGAAAGGEAGAERALDILTDELRRAMQLCGTPRVRDIDARLLHVAAGQAREPE